MSSIICGGCKNTHESVAQVRACYARFLANGQTEPSATERQHSFLVNLIAERRVAPSEGELIMRDLNDGSMTVRQASTWIKDLLDRPMRPAPTAVPQPSAPIEVPAGRYAVPALDANTGARTVRFYRVDRPTDGKWAGRTFVKVQAGDDLHPLRGAAATVALQAIAHDPQAASLLYGREIGKCGVCGRTLTDEASRAAGIGPVCAGKMDW